MNAGRKLDALVAEKVMGLDPCLCKDTFYDYDTGKSSCRTCKKVLLERYSRDIDAAWMVVEKLKRTKDDEEILEVGFSQKKGRWCAGYWTYEEKMHGMNVSARIAEWANTAPLAICLLALKAMEVKHA